MTHTVRAFSIAALAVASALASWPAAAAPKGTFASFAGNWRGAGTIAMVDGSREKIRCKGAYAVRPDDQAMNVSLLCASDSYRFDITSNVVAQGDGFAGQWQETSRQVQGDVTGRFPAPGRLEAELNGLGVSMRFSSSLSGNKQVVALQTDGADVRSVDIALTR